ncbi:MAG: hypothetical protein ND807_16010 [Vicinamibacterales bacterium]|nr:hypothetical protein [Vicinamibacterales bacterium]
MLEDQIRDWGIALGPFSELPLVGPPTHVGGYTIGPAFYWILWLIRVTVGPWFQNLPHAGGIGQAILQSMADTILLAAVWQRTRSIWLGLATIVLLATASLDLSLSALVWNPMVGSALAKIATALVILKWPERSPSRIALTTAIVWCAVQAYTGAVFVAIGVFAALLAGPFSRRDWATLRLNAAIIAVVVSLLQIPHAVHQVSTRFADSGMSEVADSIGEIVSGRQPLQLANSVAGYKEAFTFILVSPWRAPWSVWLIVLSAAIVASRFRHDLPLLSVTLLPQIAAVIGYAFYVGDFLDRYYYLSLMPAVVLTLTLSATALRPPAVARAAGIALLAGAVAIVPARTRFAGTLVRMPEYGALVDGSRELVRQARPMRAVRTQFSLPPTSNPQFIYEILGGRIDLASPWIGVIQPDGHVIYRDFR